MGLAVSTAARHCFLLSSALSKTGNFLPYTRSGSPLRENENINRSAPVPFTCCTRKPGVRTMNRMGLPPGLHRTGGRGISRCATVHSLRTSLHSAKATGRPRSSSPRPRPVKT